jgi:hypothetical protein
VARDESINNAIWDEADFYALSGPAKLIYIWTWTNRRCDFSGIYQVPLAAIASETKHEEPVVLEALSELHAASFVFYDGTWLFVKARVKRIKTGTVQMCKRIANDLSRVPEDHPYRRQLLDLQGGRVWHSKDVRTTIATELEYLASGIRDGQGSYPPNGVAASVNGSDTGGTGVALMTETKTRTETRTSKGWGAGRGNRRENPDLGPGYQASAEAIALRDEHFPDELLGSIDSVLAKIRMKRLPETPAMVGALLGREEAA